MDVVLLCRSFHNQTWFDGAVASSLDFFQTKLFVLGTGCLGSPGRIEDGTSATAGGVFFGMPVLSSTFGSVLVGQG